MKRREFVIVAATVISAPALLSSRAVHAASPIPATLYKNPSCTCCEGHAQYLEKNGFKVIVKPTNDLTEISQKAGVPEDLEGCHTMFVNDYVVDGRMPIEVIRKRLAEKPAIAGITLPGMPSGSPGMAGPKIETWTIYAVTKDGKPPKVFATI